MMFFVLTTSFTEPSGFSTDTCNTGTSYGSYEENRRTDDSEWAETILDVNDHDWGVEDTYANCFGYIFVTSPALCVFKNILNSSSQSQGLSLYNIFIQKRRGPNYLNH